MMLSEVVNATTRRLERMFPGYFEAAKHDHYRDFGYPTHLAFDQLYGTFLRNGLAHAAVEKTVLKSWQDYPFLQEHEEEHDETPLEREIRMKFANLRLWQNLAEADRRSLVGGYAGVIFRFADGLPFSQPVERVNGLDGLVEVIPAWEGQMTVAEYDMDETSETYGHPKMFTFNESQVNTGSQQKARSFQLHPDRVLIWSKDGTVHGQSFLSPGYNDLLIMEKVAGAGGEGFWKNAKSSPVLQAGEKFSAAEMASALGVPVNEIADLMNEQVENWQRGFDKLLMLQGIEAKFPGITLPSPEHFFNIALQSFSASVGMPTKILVGMQTGERASTEDASEWAQTNMARRSNSLIPNIMAMIERFEQVGVLAEKDWHLDWSDLTEPSKAEKIERAEKMASINGKMTGEVVFTGEEIRAAVDLEPLSDAERYPTEDEDDLDAADPIDPIDPDDETDPDDPQQETE